METAAWTSRRRTRLGPALVIRPRCWLSPELCSLGTRPRYASTSCARRKREAGAVYVNGTRHKEPRLELQAEHGELLIQVGKKWRRLKGTNQLPLIVNGIKNETDLAEQVNLVESFPGFIAAIQNTLMAQDYHIMVVDTDAESLSFEFDSISCTNGVCSCEPEPSRGR